MNWSRWLPAPTVEYKSHFERPTAFEKTIFNLGAFPMNSTAIQGLNAPAYVKNGKYCVVNNTYEPQDTTVYTTDGSSFALHLDANEIKWYEI